MEQSVEFRVASKRYSIQVAPEKPFFDANHVGHIIPAKIMSFDNGYLKTADPEVIGFIRGCSDFQAGKIIEITDADRDMFRPKSEQGVVRGPVSSASIQAEAGVKEPAHPISMLKKTTRCDSCGKEFQNDVGGKALRLHRLWHRRKAEMAKAVPAEGVTVEEK